MPIDLLRYSTYKVLVRIIMAEKEKSKYKILVVDDEADLRKSIIRGLSLEGHENLVEAGNGQVAIDILGNEKFDLIISDVKMPKAHGITLLHHVRRKFGSLPFIMMTGFSDVMETTEAIEIGATAFILKPFSVDDIVAEISKIENADDDKGFRFSLLEREEEDGPRPTYCPIPTKEFIRGGHVNFPIFIKLNAGHFLKIAHRAEDLDEKRIKVLEAKGVHYFYAEQEDFKRYALNSHQLTLDKLDGLKTSKKDTQELLRQSGELLAQYSFSKGIDEVIYQATVTNLKQSLCSITERQDVFNILDSLRKNQENVYSHSLAVCLVSLMIGKEVSIESSLNIYKISVSSFFHDIGMSKIPKKIQDKSRFHLFDDELKQFEDHPRLGAEELLKISDVTADIGEIIIQHHEHWDGSGFPIGPKKEKINPLARIITLADSFCYALIHGQDQDPLTTPIDIIRELEKEEGKFEPKLMKALKTIYHR